MHCCWLSKTSVFHPNLITRIGDVTIQRDMENKRKATKHERKKHALVQLMFVELFDMIDRLSIS